MQTEFVAVRDAVEICQLSSLTNSKDNSQPTSNYLVWKIFKLTNILDGKKMAQLLVGHNFKTIQKDSTELHTTSSQHDLNHIVIFQSQ